MRNILITRFSAIGDVAIVFPLLREVLEKHSDVRVFFCTRKFNFALFKNIELEFPNRLIFIDLALNKRPKGFLSLFGLRTIWSLKREITSVIDGDYIYLDLHNVLRTKLLRFFIRFDGIRCLTIDKGRLEKKKLVKQGALNSNLLKSSLQRYADLFIKAGISVDFKKSKNDGKERLKGCTSNVNNVVKEIRTTYKIGISPFSTHRGKIYPLDKMRKVLAILSEWSKTLEVNGEKRSVEIMVFGGGDKEKLMADSLCKDFDSAKNLIGVMPFEKELELMAELDLMLSMDSSALHIASNFGVPVISIWGATHYYAGFYGFNQDLSLIVEKADLKCRPCSIYGNKPCKNKVLYECLEIKPEFIAEKIKNNLIYLC